MKVTVGRTGEADPADLSERQKRRLQQQPVFPVLLWDGFWMHQHTDAQLSVSSSGFPLMSTVVLSPILSQH